MDAEPVLEKILSDARAEAGQIKKQAEDKEAAEQAKLDSRLDEYSRQTRVLAEKSAGAEKLHILAAARMDIAKQLLAEKRKILDEVFEQAQNHLKKLPNEQYRELMSKLMINAAQSGDEEVIVDINEKRIDQQLIDQVNRQLSSKGKGNLKLSDERLQIGGGVILKKGKIKNNASLKVLLSQARGKLEMELAKQLFGE
ncbi:MAG: V-type ATP synthase subunit E [Sedimentisphaerales bacterium]|nr:V-type ATP synthase subunit E [Sedimentisphaerales bacterium]